MRPHLPQLELMRSETFPFPERFAAGVSRLGTLAYFDTGAGQAKSPPLPIVLLHALGTNFTQWEYVAPELSRSARVIGIDMPGCGHSERPQRPYRMADISAAISCLLDHLGIERPLIVGHSFGGRVALDIALDQPKRPAGLVLINSAGLVHYPAAFRTLGGLLLRPAVVGTLMLCLAPLFLRRIFATPTARTEHFIEQVFGRIDPRYAYEFAHHAYPLLADLVSNVRDRLPEIRVPVQVLWGERDELLDFRHVEPVLAKLADVTIERLPSCGHMPNLENPEAVSATILRFRERLLKQGTTV